MAEYVFGANILENLTTGMYQDSRVIYREYIQNACDQIDAACKLGLLSDKSEGRIQIDIDSERRTITIEDNATGIPREQFRKKLANIADSDKLVGESKGSAACAAWPIAEKWSSRRNIPGRTRSRS